MPKIEVQDRDGGVHTLEAPDGTMLMRLLREEGLGVAGTCGGMSSCGSCHIYVRSNHPLPAPSEDEADMIEALGDIVEVRPNSRLSCQIVLGPETAGLSIEIGPQF
ncbi:ferrodoxin Fdx [Croceicoccus estronivorus]|uniref:2Fe-2S iron-sulfur cluster-binding protein n=1 Tax=Croceicoccus estronivorus TaxID=1172626 RepID=UPI00082E36B3|nr:2Fe-2S iron-sulfur cluster-binding protein [Croceicoccus estronivorus]OCC23539.1 ferrodoxin Fdx [Croceicoccus estronivorus]